MTNGLVLGKFMPLHNGHIALLNFAEANCVHLNILVCFTANEEIPGNIRVKWMEQFAASNNDITVIPLQYDESVLPATSESSREVSYKWASFIKTILPKIDVIFSSEPYGDYLAEFMQAKHLAFDTSRISIPVSGSKIRTNPFKYWDYLPQMVKPYFVKKIVLLGSESTGKSVLTQKLAAYFNTAYVPEMAREIIEQTEECLPEHLHKIALLHALTTNDKTKHANKVLICDTDVLITKSYSEFFFNQPLLVDGWIEEANKMDMFFFLKMIALLYRTERGFRSMKEMR